MPQLLDVLREQFSATSDQVRALTGEIAEAPDGAATEEQQANLEALNGTLEALGPRIEQARAMEDRMHAGASLLAGGQSADGALDRIRSASVELSEFVSWGEYARALAAGDVSEPVAATIDRLVLQSEAAQRSRIDASRAFVDQTTANLTGILPPTWLTDIVDFIGTMRPFVSAFSTRPLPPSGMSISFPTVTVRPLVGVQAAEKGDIPSRATVITPGTSNVVTYGGGEDVSIQAIQRTEPAYLAIVNELYAEEMAVWMDTAAVTAGLAAAPGGNDTTLAADGSDIAAKLAAIGKIILAARSNFDTWVMGLDVWEAVVGAADADGRPLFPNIGPSNPVGTAAVNSATGSARGVTFIADPNMPAGESLAGDSRAFTTMLGGVQTLRADNPSKLGVDFAVYEFAAFAARRPAALVKVSVGA